MNKYRAALFLEHLSVQQILGEMLLLAVINISQTLFFFVTDNIVALVSLCYEKQRAAWFENTSAGYVLQNIQKNVKINLNGKLS